MDGCAHSNNEHIFYFNHKIRLDFETYDGIWIFYVI